MAPESVSIGKDVLQKHAGAYGQPVTLQVMELAFRDGHLGPRQSSQALVPTSANRMRAAGTEFLFATDGSGFDLRPLTGGPAIHFERHESVTLTRPQCGAFPGVRDTSCQARGKTQPGEVLPRRPRTERVDHEHRAGADEAPANSYPAINVQRERLAP